MTLVRTFAADPPWKRESGGGKVKRGADRHYPLLHVSDIFRVMTTHAHWKPDPACCSMWLWATAATLGDAMWLLTVLGFRYVSARIWLKTRANGKKVVGLGQRFRHRAELLLLGTMGRVPIPPPANRVDSVLEAPRGRHSEKPAQAYADMELHDGPGRRVEFFARAPRVGWDVMGNEVAEGITSEMARLRHEHANKHLGPLLAPDNGAAVLQGSFNTFIERSAINDDDDASE